MSFPFSFWPLYQTTFGQAILAFCGLFDLALTPEHANLYAFPNLHDGVDVMPISLLPLTNLGYYTTNYLNRNGIHSSCAVYRIEKILPEPHSNPVGYCWIRCGDLTLPGVLIEGQSYLSVRYWAASDRSQALHWDKTRLTVTLY